MFELELFITTNIIIIIFLEKGYPTNLFLPNLDIYI